MKIIDVPQGSQEWLDIRIGLPTSSNFSKIIDTAGKRSKQRTEYLYQVAGERLSGQYHTTFKSEAMQHGNDTEEEASQMYSLLTGNDIEKIGFCLSDCGRWGASPDRLIASQKGLLEVKCPLAKTQVKRLIKDELPTEYFQQVQGQLFVTGFEWCDFFSYFAGMEPFLIRVMPDKDYHKRLEEELNSFCDDLDKLINKIRGQNA